MKRAVQTEDWQSIYGRASTEEVERPKLNVSLIQMSSKENARDENVEKACRCIDQAMKARPKPDLVVLPEFFNIEYVFQYRDYKYISYAEPNDGYTMSRIKERARKHGVHIIATIYEAEAAGLYFDTAMLVSPDGEIVGKYRKTHPAAVSSLEKIYFKRGSRFPIFDVMGWKVGVMICYDSFFPETARLLMVNGAELITVPFAAPMFPMWYTMLQARAFDNLSYLAVCNKVGVEGKWFFGGGSVIISPYGEIIQRGSEKEDDMLSASLDQNLVFEARRRYPTFRDRRPEIYASLCKFEEDARSLQ